MSSATFYTPSPAAADPLTNALEALASAVAETKSVLAAIYSADAAECPSLLAATQVDLAAANVQILTLQGNANQAIVDAINDHAASAPHSMIWVMTALGWVVAFGTALATTEYTRVMCRRAWEWCAKLVNIPSMRQEIAELKAKIADLGRQNTKVVRQLERKKTELLRTLEVLGDEVEENKTLKSRVKQLEEATEKEGEERGSLN